MAARVAQLILAYLLLVQDHVPGRRIAQMAAAASTAVAQTVPRSLVISARTYPAANAWTVYLVSLPHVPALVPMEMTAAQVVVATMGNAYRAYSTAVSSTIIALMGVIVTRMEFAKITHVRILVARLILIAVSAVIATAPAIAYHVPPETLTAAMMIAVT